MPEDRRFRVPGGTYCLTINLLERRSYLLPRHITVLRETARRTRRERPFRSDAWMVLPEHMHCLIRQPENDNVFSNRIKAIKIRFVRAIPATELRSRTRIAPVERAIWQRRFREHAVRSDAEHACHMDSVHYGPARYGYVTFARNWPYSTFHRLAKAGLDPADWGPGDLEAYCTTPTDPQAGDQNIGRPPVAIPPVVCARRISRRIGTCSPRCACPCYGRG